MLSQVSSVATTTGTATTVSLVATNYLGDGSISTFEPSKLVEVSEKKHRESRGIPAAALY